MAVHHFHVLVDRAPTVTQRRSLAELPAPPRIEPDARRLAFDRTASALAEAVARAIHEVEATELHVVRVEDRDLLTLSEIGARIGRSREIVRLWSLGRQGPGGFPVPITQGRDTAYFSWAQVAPWLRDHLGYELPDDEPVVAATNLALQLRALSPRIRAMKIIRDLLTAA